jgi:hypothetical protein
MRQAWTDAPLLSPGIRIYDYPDHPIRISRGRSMRFDGEVWSESGDVVDAGI